MTGPEIQPARERGVHPRPQLEREAWQSLDGDWRFAYDDDQRWQRPADVTWSHTIKVPYPPESVASGINDTHFHPVCWYGREVSIGKSERLLLHFGAVDYSATVWVNDRLVAEHQGGHTPFTADITAAVAGAERAMIVVRAHDDPHDLAKPRGKQDWCALPHEIWYPRTSGIWQTVWLEPVGATRIDNLTWTPHLDRYEMQLDVSIVGPIPAGLELRLRLVRGDELLAEDRYGVRQHELSRRIGFDDPGIDDYRNHLMWSPARPVIMDADLELWCGDRCLDRVSTYTALRSVGTTGARFMLNGRPFYLRMVLDQGYWADTLMASTPAALRRDVELTRALGFNGVRKHQKLEDPRWLYWCDRLGLLVWAEMPSPYRFNTLAVERLTAEWLEALHRDRSHPSIAAWVPLNESWGVPDLGTNPAHRDYVRALYHLTKTLDPHRPVVGNDGWEHVATDLVTIHDYAGNPRIISERYATPEAVELLLRRQQPGGRPITIAGFELDEHPVILSEFGGIAQLEAGQEGWGYSRVTSSEQLLTNYTNLLRAVHGCRGIAGFCYTQLTDTFQERNGLCTADRRPKAALEQLAAATRGRRNAQAMDVNPPGPGPGGEEP